MSAIAPSSPTHLIAGHSHIAALGVPLQAMQPEVVAIPGFSSLAGFSGPWNGNRDAAYWAVLANISAQRTVIVNWSGNEHNALFLLRHSPDFDFQVGVPELDSPVSAATLIPKLMIEQLFLQRLAGLRPVLEQLTQAGAACVMVLGTPPPKRDLESLRDIIRTSDFWRSRSLELGHDPELPSFSPPALRLKLWMVLQSQMDEIARVAGANFLPVPQAVQDESGFLRRELWAQDLTHANAEYGKILLPYLAEQLGVSS